LLFVISIAGLIFGVEAARGEIFAQLQGLIGQQGAKALEDLLESADKPAESMTPALIGVALLIDRRHNRMRRAAGCAGPDMASTKKAAWNGQSTNPPHCKMK